MSLLVFLVAWLTVSTLKFIQLLEDAFFPHAVNSFFLKISVFTFKVLVFIYCYTFASN